MIRVDGRKLQEVKDHFSMLAENEIKQSTTDDGVELGHDDIVAIKNKYTFKSVEVLTAILDSGPEKIFKQGFALDPNGWRSGYTKSPVSQRKTKNRKKNKLARVARKTQRKLQNK